MKINLQRLIIYAMKLSLVGIFSQCLLLNLLMAGNIKAQKKSNVKEVVINIDVKEVSILELFGKLEEKTQFHFTYDYKVISENKAKISLSEKKKSVEEVLLKVSKEAKLRFKQVDNNINVNPLKGNFDSEIEVILEDVDISGKITDENGEGLPGASVLEKGTTNGVTTNLDGNYKLTVPEDATIVISFVGYSTQEILVGAQSRIDVQMEADAAQLKEVVVVGFGNQSRAKVTGSISTIDESDIRAVANKSVAQTLQGRIPGLQVIRNSGAPNAAASLTLRGPGSINGGTDPLVLVDGIESSINDVNPSDVQSVSVLKDASAASVYGAKAANGVILITTKRGNTDGTTNITYGYSVGIQDAVGLPKMLRPQEFAILQNEARINANSIPLWTDSQIEELGNNNTDWIDEVLKTGIRHQHNIALSGGNGKGQYNWSTDYLTHDGILYGSEYKRITSRLNLNHKLNKWFTVGTNAYFRYEENIGGDGFHTAANYSPTVSPKIGGITGTGGVNSDYDNTASTTVIDPISAFDIENRSADVDNPSYLIQNNAYFTITPIKGLEIKSTLGLRFNFSRSRNYNPAFEYYDMNGIEGGSIVQQRLQSETSLSEGYGEGSFWAWTNTVSYEKSFDVHNFKVLIGNNAQVTSSRSFSANDRGLPSAAVQQLGQGEQPDLVSGTSEDWSIYSIFGRFNYDYNGKYLAQFSFRRDGSSRFGPQNKFVFFPSASIGWVLSEEAFLSGITWLNFLKLRVGYGILGNQNGLGNTNYIATYALNRSTFFDSESGGKGIIQSGAAASNFPNGQIKWEQTATTNIGVDARLFNNKIDLTLEYFRKSATDLLLAERVPLSTGFNSGEGQYTTVIRNSGEALNTGLEMSARYFGKIGSELNFDIGFSGAYLKNKIIALTPGVESIVVGTESQILNKVGGPINGNHGYIADGIYQNQEELDALPRAGAGVGDIRFRDINSPEGGDIDLNANGTIEPNEMGIGGRGIPDGLVTPDDRDLIGDPNPNFILGVNFGVQYKGIDFGLQLQGDFGRDFISQDQESRTRFNGNLAVNSLNRAFERWTGEGSNNEFPRLRAGSTINDPTSTYHLQDGSYVRIREIELGYTIPSSVLEKIKANTIRIYANISNLLTLTDYYGFEVERAGSYGRGSIYPQSRTITFGISAKF